jgi:hypothetical protein
MKTSPSGISAALLSLQLIEVVESRLVVLLSI